MIVSSTETIGGFNSGFDTDNQHRTTTPVAARKYMSSSWPLASPSRPARQGRTLVHFPAEPNKHHFWGKGYVGGVR